jgi:hypothetical protein
MNLYVVLQVSCKVKFSCRECKLSILLIILNGILISIGEYGKSISFVYVLLCFCF